MATDNTVDYEGSIKVLESRIVELERKTDVLKESLSEFMEFTENLLLKFTKS